MVQFVFIRVYSWFKPNANIEIYGVCEVIAENRCRVQFVRWSNAIDQVKCCKEKTEAQRHRGTEDTEDTEKSTVISSVNSVPLCF